MIKPEITLMGIFDIQVCVPKDWTDKQVVKFANTANPCGVGWKIRKEGHPVLNGDPERNPCAVRTDFVHIMLEM